MCFKEKRKEKEFIKKIMTRAKREQITHLYRLSDKGDITEWKVHKQGRVYIDVEGSGEEAKYGWQTLIPYQGITNNIKAWCTKNAKFSLGLFFLSREDATEYQSLYKESQTELAEPNERKVVKIKHLVDAAYASLREARRLQAGLDD